MITLEKELLLKAVEQNWGMIGPEEWREITWFIYDDGSYDIISEFNSFKENKQEISGLMKSEDFLKLCEAIKCDPWRDPNLDVEGCDGEAWEIEAYKNGIVAKTSGSLDYIYGHRILETIVSLLPNVQDFHSDGACVFYE